MRKRCQHQRADSLFTTTVPIGMWFLDPLCPVAPVTRAGVRRWRDKQFSRGAHICLLCQKMSPSSLHRSGARVPPPPAVSYETASMVLRLTTSMTSFAARQACFTSCTMGRQHLLMADQELG